MSGKSGLGEAGAALLRGRLARIVARHGGDLSELVHIALEDGREAMVKNGPAPDAEGEMLEAIAAAGAPAPKVIAMNGDVLVMEVLEEGGGAHSASASLGRALKTLHAERGERYGWHRDFAFGRVAIENGWADDWPAFWGERRLLTSVRHVDARLARRLESLAADLSNRLPARPAASLLHGDMWAGNVVAAGGEVTGLVDPASYYGHAEVDLAMLTLFGGPCEAFFEAYGPLEPGHEERRPIYQLWPALVHLRLFGSGYRSMVERFLSAAGV
ncbi:fructosamine kinase family protein [Afifella sp. IM 167]|uniref:fructosamine kinase family protein n=1 Tax=Afifella sp. IM 167 TaxID=2033586 RepID=UPI001CCBD8C9|nr:fructosamine kinase family protein [Afifella sp. IM 167]MBZ8134406.1 aminoglycoside phosphotransferase [Afifella sp. IM 167]